MTMEQAKTYMLQLNTEKAFNATEHEAIRCAIKSLEEWDKVLNVVDTDNHTNGDVFRAVLKIYFPKTLIIWSKNEAYRTMGVVFSEEWWSKAYKAESEEV